MATTRSLTTTSAAAATVESDLSALEDQFGPFESLDPDRARYTTEFAQDFPTLAGLLTQARQVAPSAPSVAA